MNRATAGEDQDRSQEEGLGPLKLWVKRLIDEVNETEFGETDLEFCWHDAAQVDPQVQSGIDDTALRNGSATVNEVRARRGQAPVDGGDVARVYGPAATPLAAPNASAQRVPTSDQSEIEAAKTPQLASKISDDQ
ncbi:MAG: hypothetical protein WDM85_19955 [Caulobacteraceae bacterium]